MPHKRVETEKGRFGEVTDINGILLALPSNKRHP